MERKDYSVAIRWLEDRSVPRSVIATLFGRKESSVKSIAWRDLNRRIPRKVADVLSDVHQAGISADQILSQARIDEGGGIEEPGRIAALEEQIDSFGREFWTKVRDHEGAKELGSLLRKVSRPSSENIPLQRAAAQLYHLLAEVYLHAGCCRSSLTFGLRAYRAEEELYKETLSRKELFSIGKTCLLISQALINRSEFSDALAWISRSKQAFEAGSHHVDPEAYKQLATVQFHSGAMREAESNYRLAGRLLAAYKHRPSVSVAEVKDIGERHLNLTAPGGWEKAFELSGFAIEHWPAGDIHQALNVNWAAAAGLIADCPEANQRALVLLNQNRTLSKGYLHPETMAELLIMTPQLPRRVRADWARFCLHYNAFRNK